MKKIGTKGLVFGSPEEIREHDPDHTTNWATPKTKGLIGDAVIREDGTPCISIFIGGGQSVLISEEGAYIAGDTAGVPTESRTESGAWLPRELYEAALEDHRSNS